MRGEYKKISSRVELKGKIVKILLLDERSGGVKTRASYWDLDANEIILLSCNGDMNEL